MKRIDFCVCGERLDPVRLMWGSGFYCHRLPSPASCFWKVSEDGQEFWRTEKEKEKPFSREEFVKMADEKHHRVVWGAFLKLSVEEKKSLMRKLATFK